MNRLLIACAAAALLSACKPAAEKNIEPATAPPTGSPSSAQLAPAVGAAPENPKAHQGEVHWGYEGEQGPGYWAGLSPGFSACGDGRHQSPIDLIGAVPTEGKRIARVFGETFLSVDSRARVMDLIDNGHTIQVSSDAEMSLDVDGTHYELVQYHFHAPSEHTIDGRHSPMEVHFVHESADGQLAVAGVLIEEGEAAAFLEPVIAGLPSDEGGERHLEGLKLDTDSLNPLPDAYYRYDGSLTTPPCSEGVRWFISKEYYTASPEQIGAIASHLHKNNRPVQPLNDRELALVSIKN
jgi:carbonic anhydrase